MSVQAGALELARFPVAPPRALEVRLAVDADELDAAQRLRYDVFFEEWGARPDPSERRPRRDVDEFDGSMEHLVVIDHRRSRREGQVVGNYRLLPWLGEGAMPRFYSSGEFDLTPLLGSGMRLLELGRSCVLRDYRQGLVVQLLWRAIAGYVAERRIDLMFGCASLRGTDPKALAESLSYLHHFHAAPAALRPKAIGSGRVPMDQVGKCSIDPGRARAGLEPIIKGYLRAGAGVGDGACIDHQFNTTDVCIVLPTAQMTRRYQRSFERNPQRGFSETTASMFVD